MLRKVIFVFTAVLCCMYSVLPANAQLESPPLSDPMTSEFPALHNNLEIEPEAWRAYQIQPGEIFSCLAARSGLEVETLAQINTLLNPAALSVGQELRLPEREPSISLSAAHSGETRLALALKHNLPLWQVQQLNPQPLFAGQRVRLPGPAAQGACLPYPLLEMSFDPQPVVRGRTAALILETAEPVACEVSYLGQNEPCYPLDETHFYALIALSALQEPGTYDLELRLQANGLDTSVKLPLEVQAGRYGFQFINPPASLNALMDADLMYGELDYLAQWRAVRTSERHWELPLSFPLPFYASVSAAYGDKRSYGGMVDGYHSGIDYRAWTGVPVLAAEDGVIMMAETLQARGNALLIDHGWGLVTGYWHLSRLDVEVGQHVMQGEQIGLVGNTGLSTGSHLHWEVWANGISVDGEQWLAEDAFADMLLSPLDELPEAAGILLTPAQ